MTQIAGNDARAGYRGDPRWSLSGFTLVEMMIVIGIAAIVLAMAAPGFSALIQNLRVTAATNDFFSAINLARSEAIKRGARVNMTTVAADGNWEDGWVVFVDRNDNLRPDAGDEIVQEYGPAGRGIAIQSNFDESAGKYLSYNGTGRTRSNASGQAIMMGTFSLVVDGEVKRKIVINMLGRPRSCNAVADPKNC
jgi:type IV fimbrial biogenesis protein FimT